MRRLLVEEGADIRKELYVAMVSPRLPRAVLMASIEGGRTSRKCRESPDKIHKSRLTGCGLTDPVAEDIARKIGAPYCVLQAREFSRPYQAFDQLDASLAEINP